jgi:hypothetical protein
MGEVEDLLLLSSSHTTTQRVTLSTLLAHIGDHHTYDVDLLHVILTILKNQDRP